MPKEHAGGVCKGGLARAPGEWSDGARFAVKIDHFNFEDLDSIDDLVKEELRTRGSVKGLFRKFISLEEQKIRAETVVQILSHIIYAHDSGLAAVQLSFACGMMTTATKSMTELADEFGISKEAMQQGVDAFTKELDLPKTGTMRDEGAREKMRQANFRR